jgi:hypothetical protein
MTDLKIGPAFTVFDHAGTSIKGLSGCNLLTEYAATMESYQTAADVAAILGSPPPIGINAKNTGTFTDIVCDWMTSTTINTGGVGGPTWSSGTAAPSTTCPVGSLYSRVGGAVGSTLYVSRGGGTWVAVAGV